jgi:hypothetical protein
MPMGVTIVAVAVAVSLAPNANAFVESTTSKRAMRRVNFFIAVSFVLND